MTDKRISELDSIVGSDTAATDVFVVVDTSTGTTKKITRAELNNAIERDVLASVDITTANIDGGTIDGVTIGATTSGDATFEDLTVTSNAILGDDSTDTVTINAHAASSFIPSTDSTYTLGDSSNYWSHGYIDAITTTGEVIVGGNLTVNGTTTTLNSTELAVDDLNITVASGAADAAAADGAGLTVDGASATFNYTSSGDKWTMNKPLDVTGNIIVSGTVDGRDLQTDGTKLDGIETAATADQTGAEIATAISGQTVATLTITSATINGGTIAGTVTGTTQTAGTNDTTLATTAYADTAANNAAVAMAIALG